MTQRSWANMSFISRYRGHCDECENSIEIGDDAFYDQNNELRHVQCPRPVVICQKCYLAKPCGCDDE